MFILSSSPREMGLEGHFLLKELGPHFPFDSSESLGAWRQGVNSSQLLLPVADNLLG